MKYTGLSMDEVRKRQLVYGKNQINIKKKHGIMKVIKHVLKEPIYLLLFSSAMIYYLLGSPMDGGIMIGFVIIVVGIDVLQDVRTERTLKKLKAMTSPKTRTIREGVEQLIDSVDLVPGDYIIVHEGVKVPVDGILLEASGLKMDESIITGETQGVWKETLNGDNRELQEGVFLSNYCYCGTLVLLGKGIIKVEKTGNSTQYGQVVEQMSDKQPSYSPLEKQMSRVAFQCTIVAIILFFIVALATYFNTSDHSDTVRIIQSLLAGTVLALSMVPGEFPVIKSVFLTMGALRLAKKSALVRKLSSIEGLGSITTLCVDKTGTVTENDLVVKEIWVKEQQEIKMCSCLQLVGNRDSVDPLDKAIVTYCYQLCENCGAMEQYPCEDKMHQKEFIKEYPFTNELKATGQVWRKDVDFYISVKGSPEAIIKLCGLDLEEEMVVESKMKEFTDRGLRIIGFAKQIITKEHDIPKTIMDCQLHFVGMIGLEDPPRENMKSCIKNCYDSGIRVCMITGDHPNTAIAIGKKIGINIGTRIMTGEDIQRVTKEELIDLVKECNVFARVLPLQKMKIVEALQEAGELVAMTGDGVNDSAALSIADVGIAMGRDGSEVCREAADVILLDNNFATILDTIWDGRRIYQNIVKAVGYVLSIHIPIALISFIAPLIQIPSEELMLLPMHIILLELVMNPICSIVLERQPLDKEKVIREKSKPVESLLSKGLLRKSFLQGGMIFMASFFLYLIMRVSCNPSLARTAGFSVLVLSNILLVLENCSDYSSITYTMGQIKRDFRIWGVNGVIIMVLLILVYTPINSWFGFVPMSFPVILIVVLLSLISVLWYELVKMKKSTA